MRESRKVCEFCFYFLEDFRELLLMLVVFFKTCVDESLDKSVGVFVRVCVQSSDYVGANNQVLKASSVLSLCTQVH